MNPELHHFLTQGPRTVKDLARLTELSTSTIYKAINSATDIQSKDSPSGKVFWMAPTADDVVTPETVSKPILDVGEALAGEVVVEPVDSTQIAPEGVIADTDEYVDFRLQTEVEETPKAERRGRKATGAGKKLWPGPSLKTEDVGADFDWINPRRKESHGYRSLQIVIDKPGITTEDFVAQGGRLNDLRWDLARGRIEMKG